MITKHIKSFLEKRGFVLGGDLNKNDRAGALHRAWGHIFTNHIYGDYVEFGVYQGSSFVESYNQYKTFERWLQGQLASPEAWRRKVAQRYSGHKVHFHGLDTFSGMPKNSEDNALSLKEPMFLAMSRSWKNALGQGCRLTLFRCIKACSLKQRHPFLNALVQKLQLSILIATSMDLQLTH